MPARSCDAAHRAYRYEVFAPCPIPYLISATIETHKYIGVPVSAELFLLTFDTRLQDAARGEGMLKDLPCPVRDLALVTSKDFFRIFLIYLEIFENPRFWKLSLSHPILSVRIDSCRITCCKMAVQNPVHKWIAILTFGHCKDGKGSGHP